MRAPLAALLVMAIVSAAMAQPPQEITTNEVMSLRVEQTKTFRFNQPVTRITLSAKEVAEVIPESDRIINVRGLKQGETLLTAYGSDGTALFRSHIEVVPGGPAQVRVYGQARSGRGFVGYYCNSVSCGRPDPDVGPTPFSTTISDTQQRPDGGSQTISREYR